MSVELEEQGLTTVALDSLGDWRPGRGGSAVAVAETAEQIEAMALFVQQYPHIPVVAVTPTVTVEAAALLLRSGATGVVAESASGEGMVDAVMAALRNEVLLPDHIGRAFALWVPEGGDFESWISEEEVQWLNSMADGLTVAELADQVGYSERAMFRSLRKLYSKLGVANRTEALLWASRRGLLPRD